MHKSVGNIIDRSIRYNLNFNARNIIVYHRTSGACGCVTNIDEFYGTGGFNSDCGTCMGTGIIYTDTAQSVKCVVNKFVGSRGFLDEHQRIQSIDGDSEVRLTCLLKDALVNIHSTMGATYFSSADKVWIDDKFYQPKSHKRILAGNDYILEIVLREVSR
jgi:hypothetical protein